MYTIGGVLYHSAKGTEWGKHKYIDKIRKNGKWVYTYKITGKGYKDAANGRIDDAKYYKSEREKSKKAVRDTSREYMKNNTKENLEKHKNALKLDNRLINDIKESEKNG